MKIYENANDQHVRKVVLYEVGAGLAFDEAGTELLTKEEIVDAFLKGCVVENEGNYKTPTGVNVTESGAELVFGGGGSGGGMVVHFEVDENGNVTSDKTVAEVEEALKTIPVSGYYEISSVGVGGALTIGYYSIDDDTTGDVITQLMFGVNYAYGDGVHFSPTILANNNAWVAIMV